MKTGKRLLAAAGLAVSWSNATAQVSEWIAGSGNWSDAAKWTAGVPNDLNVHAIIYAPGAYTVTVNMSPTVATLQKLNPNALLTVPSQRIFKVWGGLFHNNGRTIINSSAADVQTVFWFDMHGGPALLTADPGQGGRLTLNGSGGNLLSATLMADSGVTNDVHHTIDGAGLIDAYVKNLGIIEANSPGKVLQFIDGQFTNSGLIAARPGAVLTFYQPAITQTSPSAEILADGGTINFDTASVTGGQLNSTGAGTVTFAGLCGMTDLSGNAYPFISSGAQLSTNGVISLSGGTTVNRSAANASTSIYAATSTVWNASTITLNAYAGNLDSASLKSAGNALFTNNATIIGRGRIYANLQNNGQVFVGGSGSTIELLSGDKFNDAIVKAVDSALLKVASITLTQGASGQLLADNASVHLYNATISGGQVNAVNGGRTTITSSSTFTGGVSGSGPIDINQGQVLYVKQPAWDHAGEVLVNTSATNSITHVQFDQSCVVSHAILRLNASDDNLDSSAIKALGTATVTIDETSVVNGMGRIHAALTNNGTVRAGPGGLLELVNEQKFNNALIQASNTGIVGVGPLGFALTQGPSGVIHADNGLIYLSGCTISGGQLIASSGGSVNVANASTLNAGVSGSGPINVLNGKTLTIDQPSWNHAGVVAVNSGSGGSTTVFRLNQSSTLHNVTIQLNRNSSNASTSQVNIAPSSVGTYSSTATLAGSGRVYNAWNMGGTMAPGRNTGTRYNIDVAGSVTFQSSGVLDTEIGGAASFGYINGAGSVTVAGTIRARLINAFSPSPGQTFDVVSVTTRNGTFAATDFERFAEGPERFVVSYPAGKVRLHARKCAADWNADGFVNGDDYDSYGELFEAGDTTGDFNNDGFVNGDDYDAFASAFEAGC